MAALVAIDRESESVGNSARDSVREHDEGRQPDTHSTVSTLQTAVVR